MSDFTYKSPYSQYDNCYFKVGRYATNNNLAIMIKSRDEGNIATVTVNTDVDLEDDMIAIKDYSENEGMLEWLLSMDIIQRELVGVIESGYVNIPVARLSEKGKQIVADGMDK